MKNLSLLLLPLLLLWGLFSQVKSSSATETEGKPAKADTAAPAFALLELFTSQGCSSCPPADEQLARLATRGEEGENVYVLSYHVDYWNYLGWEDPFSDARFSERQRRYAARLNSRVYTPQLVVNGRTEMVGSRQRETEAAVDEALEQAGALGLTFTTSYEKDRVRIDYRINGESWPKDTRLVAVAAQNAASRAVKRGENRGRELHHVNVVRAFARQPVRAATGSILLELPAELGEHDIVVFLQDGEAGPVLAAKK